MMYGGGYAHANANMAAMGGMGGVGMQMQMMGLGGGNFANMFMYSGTAIGLQTRLEQLGNTDTSNIREATITCSGAQITEMNVTCLVCTIIWGSLIIIPIFFMCCDWWKRMVYPSYNIPQVTYQSLQYLLNAPNIQTLTMNIVDSRLNKAKCQLLYDMLSRTRLKGFTLVNGAMNFDLEADQYSNFEEHMRPIKKLPIVSEIRWAFKIVN